MGGVLSLPGDLAFKTLAFKIPAVVLRVPLCVEPGDRVDGVARVVSGVVGANCVLVDRARR